MFLQRSTSLDSLSYPFLLQELQVTVGWTTVRKYRYLLSTYRHTVQHTLQVLDYTLQSTLLPHTWPPLHCIQGLCFRLKRFAAIFRLVV